MENGLVFSYENLDLSYTSFVCSYRILTSGSAGLTSAESLVFRYWTITSSYEREPRFPCYDVNYQIECHDQYMLLSIHQFN